MDAKTRFFALLAGVNAFLPSAAYSYSDDACYFDRPVFSSRECFCGDLSVDALYLKPCMNDDLHYTAKVRGSPSSESDPMKVKYQFLCPDWEWGVRATAGTKNCYRNFDFAVSYTWIQFKSDEKREEADPVFAATRAHPYVVEATGVQFFNALEAELEGTYRAVDLLLSYSCPFAICHSITPFAGAQGVSFRQKLDVLYAGNLGGSPRTLEGDWHSKFEGAGLILGTDYSCALCEGLSLIARVSGSLLAGEFSVKDKETVIVQNNSGISGSTVYRFDEEKCCRLVPGWDARIGASYEVDLCGCVLAVRAGYEALALYNLSAPRRFFSEAADGNVAGSQKVDAGLLLFHGAFAGLDVKF